MATTTQRAQSIADAVLNATATLSQINRFGAAIAAQEGKGDLYAAMNQADRATYIVDWTHNLFINMVKTNDVKTATASAAAAALAAVNQEFP